MAVTTERWLTFDLVEAFQLAQAVVALHDIGLLETLEKPTCADKLAAKFRLDSDLLRGTLEFVAARTDLLRKSRDQFVATRHYSAGSRFFLDLYLGAYGGNAAELRKLLRHSSKARALVDRARYARAFAAVNDRALGILPEIISGLQFEQMLDLGCGTGDLLLALARQNSNFIGFGIDNNPSMLEVARRKVLQSRLKRRVRFFEADCRSLKWTLPASVRDKIRSLVACNVANEMFHDGQTQCVKWLQQLRKVFPQRPLLILDYYGQLGKKSRHRPVERKTLLHDYVQLISGQGIPPANAREWQTVYAKAGCKLLHIIEDNLSTRFIHILRL